jgi:transposase
MNTEINSKLLGHLGLVSGMIDELGIVTSIDTLLKAETGERVVSAGTICKALILNGLGFTQRTLYLVSSFFSDKPIEQLLGDGIESSQLNDTVLGRCLDSIHDYGTTLLYSELADSFCRTLGLQPTSMHMDSTDFHVDGVYNSREESVEASVIHITKGYSRDHRGDLNQAVLNMIVENQAGIVLHMQSLSGNTSDKTAFNGTIKQHISQLQLAKAGVYVVMDSAGYTEQTIKESEHAQIKWVSRVPETLSQGKYLVTGSYDNWQSLSENYEYISLCSNYADVKQRWLLVFSQEAYEREIVTLRKHFCKSSSQEFQAFMKLSKEFFDCSEDAISAINKFKKSCKYLTVNDLKINNVAYYANKGRPKNGQAPEGYRYFIEASVCSDLDNFEKRALTKGRFIVATNELDNVKLSDVELFKTYKKQSKVERGFRFLKDPQFMASTLFVNKPERVDALLFIMTLCLTVYAAIEHKIRKNLEKTEQTLPNQLGKEVKNPTARWVFTFFNNIQVLYINEKPVVLNLKDIHRKVIDILGPQYRKYYLLE